MRFGVFTQAFNSNPSNDFDTRYGLDSYTVQVPNISATSTTPQSRGGGTFTPGGSVGAGLYGGAGLWISAPINSKGEFQGSSWLYPQAHLQVTSSSLSPPPRMSPTRCCGTSITTLKSRHSLRARAA